MIQPLLSDDRLRDDVAAAAVLDAGSIPRTGTPRCTKFCSK